IVFDPLALDSSVGDMIFVDKDSRMCWLERESKNTLLAQVYRLSLLEAAWPDSRRRSAVTWAIDAAKRAAQPVLINWFEPQEGDSDLFVSGAKVEGSQAFWVTSDQVPTTDH